jgi:6-phosphogluconolactonase
MVPSQGGGPTHLSIDKTGKTLLLANYNSGSVTALRIGDDGRLGDASATIQHTGSSVDPDRQKGPHAHCVGFSRDNRFAFAADLGLDKLMIYRFDALKGTLTPNEPAFFQTSPAAGPRHFAFEPRGKYAYVINEMKSSMTALAYDARKGSFTELQTLSTLPKDFTGKNSGAEIEVDPTGRFVYGSNRGHDSIAVFAINSSKGTLTPVEQTPTQGKVPRGFGIDPTGGYLFAENQNSDTVVLFRRDAKSGRLTPAGQTLNIPTPVCVKFVSIR